MFHMEERQLSLSSLLKINNNALGVFLVFCHFYSYYCFDGDVSPATYCGVNISEVIQLPN